MWKWYSAEESSLPGGAPDNQGGAGETMSVVDLTEQLAQTEQLVIQLKELIREKDNELRKKDQQLKDEKESAESKVSKARLQSKAKIASLSSQLEELKKQVSPRTQDKKSDSKKAPGDGDHENTPANRGKILLLRRRIEELEAQLVHKNEDLQKKEAELEQQILRGSQMDLMLSEKEKKLAAKEAYIIDLQLAAGTITSRNETASLDNTQEIQKDTSNQELQVLIQNLTRKVGDSEEKYSLLQEQTESLKILLNKEKDHFKEREAMYTENIRVFQKLVQEKEKEIKEQSEKHEQEIFKLAAKSDATADLHQLLKALKQKLHEEEEVLLGKNQVIDVLQKELDNKDQLFIEMNEKNTRLQSEKENLQSKLEAEKHVMRAQLRDMMEKHETELHTLRDRHSVEIQEVKEKYELEIQEKDLTVLQLQRQLHHTNNKGENIDTDEITVIKLQDEVNIKTEEASKSDAKFLKLKAWSKSKIRQLEEELRISEGKHRDLSVLRNRVSELEDEKRELETKLDTLMDIQTINEQLLAKLVIYEEQQRKLQADLEQVTKRANSQTSESGSVDELHNQLEWNEMSPESDVAQENISEGKSVLALRMVQIEEEREGLIEDDWFFPGCSDPAMDSGQQELEEELSAARGLGKVRPSRRKGSKEVQREQEDFDFPRKDFEDQNMTLDSVDSGENMGGLRSVVEELELERNQLQEQIMSLEERCQELEDRLQLQIRIESLQSENERFQSQIVQLRQQQTRENEKHLNLTSTLNEQLKGLTDRTAFLENSIAEKDQILLESKGKLEKQAALKKVLQEKEDQLKMLSEKLGQSEEQHEETMKEQTATKAECAALKVSNNELTEKVAVLKDRLLKQDSSLEKTQLDLEQTNEELDRLNTSHLEERSQLIHDLQRCEREMDILKDVLKEKDKELSSVSSSLSEYAEQVIILKEQINFKDDQMREMTNALAKVEREFHLLREAQTSDVQETSSRISALSDQLREMEVEFNNAKYLSEAKAKEAKDLYRQIDENGITIKNLHSEIQAQSVTHNNHIIECSSQITSLKEQITAKVTETEAKYQIEIESLRSRLEQDVLEREKTSGLLDEKSKNELHFESELKLAKEQYNILVSDLTKKHEEVQQLMNELAEQKQCCDHLKKELQEKASSFQQKLESDIGLREEKLRGLQGNVEEYQKQLNEKLENIKALEADKNGLCDQIKSLQAAVAERDQKLKAQLHTMEENRKNILALEQQKQQMDSEKDELMKELTNRESEVGSLNQTLQDLQRKMEETELWLAEERKNVSHLMGDKEELQSKISQVSEQSLKRDTEISKQLEDKSMECLSLTKQLCVEQQASIHSQNHLQVLESQLKESEKCAQQNAVEMELRKGEYNILCERFRLSEETSVLLKKQVEELTTANERERQVLHEKDQVINTQHAEIGQWKASFAHLQNEEQNLREELRRLSQQAAELNSAVENEKLDRGKMQKELDCKIEENASLRSSLESVNTVVDGLNREKEEAATFVTSLESQRDHFQAHGLQIQTETDSLKKQLIDLKSENEKLNCDIKLLNSNLADKVEEINVLSSHLSQQGHTILSLKDQLDTVIVESKTLLKTIEEKEVVISQKEELIQLTEKRLEGENRYLQKISALQNELQSSGSELEQQRQKMKDQELDLRNLAKELKLYKDKSEEAQLLKVQLSEHVEVISDLHSQNKDLRERVDQLSGSLTQKEEALKEKFDIFLNLQALYADAQEALDVQKKQVEHLMSKNVQYETLTSEKDCAIKKWEVDYGELNVKLADKETMCETLTQQVAELQKINGNENQKLTELNLLIKERENSLLAKESKIQELTSRLKDSEMSIKEKETAVQNLQEKYASLHDGKCELEQSVVIKEEEISRLLNSLQEKEEHLHQTENKVLSFSNEVGLLREELDRCSSNLKNVSLSIQEKDETILLKQQSVQSIEAQLQSQKEEFQKALSQLHALKQEVDQKNLAIKHLKEERNSQCQLVQNLNLDVDRLNSEHLKSLNKHILQKEELESKVHSTNQEKMLLDAALKALEVEKENRVALLQKQLFEKADLAKKLQDKLDVHVKEAEVQLSANTLQLKNENADLQKQISEMSSFSDEHTKLRTKIAELERLLFQARSSQEKAGREIASYQNELAELRSQKNLLISESQALQHRYSVSLAEKDRHISELSQMQKEATLIPSTLYETKELERVALVRSSKPLSGEHARTEIQQYLQEIKERDLIIQQINSKAIESVQMNDTLSSQLKDSQTRYCELQTQYYTLQRDFHTVQVSSPGDIQTEVPPGAPQERANVLVEMDNFELIELRRRLVESEHQYDSLQQELSQLSERLAEERRLRGAAEDALSLAEQHIKRVEVKTPSREFSLQMESDDEREALIIDPTQHVMVRKIKGGALSLRRWLRGRSLYCSKLLTSRSKSRYIFLTYLVFLHVVVLMCLMGFS